MTGSGGATAQTAADRRGRAPRPPRSDDSGAVTAELALALPAVVLIIAVLLVTASAASAQLRCADAARAAARVAALGQSDPEVADVAHRVAGAGAGVLVRREPEWVTVTVSAELPGSWFTGGALRVGGTATAWLEP